MATKLRDGKQEPVEELYKELDYLDEADASVLVMRMMRFLLLLLLKKWRQPVKLIRQN